MKRKNGKRAAVWMCAVAVAGLAVALPACAPKANPGTPEPQATSPAYVPEANQYGVVTARSWADQYPDQYSTYLENNANAWPEGKTNKLEAYPEYVTLGKGYGYANFFTEAGGHSYAMYTVTHNGRINENSKTQCLACKTPNVHFQVAQDGNDVWKTNLYETMDAYTDGSGNVADAEGITCANCHENNDPSKLSVLRADWKRVLGSEADTRSLSGEVCGQCHCDYSMNAETGEPTSPYEGISTMTPDQAIQWYDDHNVTDWTYKSTGTPMIAVRHAEYEFNYGGEGNHMTKLGYDCADCHMAVQTDENGEAYHSHMWSDPLDNEDLLQNDCNTCHQDLKSEVQQTRSEIDSHTHQVGMRAACYVQNFEKAIQAGTVSDEDLPRLQQIQRHASYYWNLASAENSKGAHNKELFTQILDKADSLLDEGDQILGVESTADGFVSEYDPEKNTIDYGSDHWYNQTPASESTQDYGSPEAEEYGK